MQRIAAILLATHFVGCSMHQESMCGLPFDQAMLTQELAAESRQLVQYVERIDSALGTCPSDQGLLKKKFFALLRLGAYEEVATTYERLVALGTPDFGAHEEVAHIYLEQKNSAQALVAFERALKTGPKADLLYERARLLVAAGRVEEAIVDLEKALALAAIPDPVAPTGAISIQIPDAYQIPAGTLLFDLYWNLGRVAEARSALARLNRYSDSSEVSRRRVILETGKAAGKAKD